MAAGVLSAGHARALLAVPEPAGQERLAQRIGAEGLSVRAVEELVALGETGKSEPPATRIPRSPDRSVQELAARLSDHYETRVRIEHGRSRGRIVIDFATPEDLERIVDAMRLEAG